MSVLPEWLPPQVLFGGDWHAFSNVLYSVFERDFKSYPKPEFRGHVVFHDNRHLESDREEGYWHVTTKRDPNTGDRFPDIERSKRLTWIRPIIEHPDDASVRCFDRVEGRGKVRTYLWLFEWDFVVVLEKQDRGSRKIARLITAYCVEGEWSRRRLQQKYDSPV
jgi:hypothetical protein